MTRLLDRLRCRAIRKMGGYTEDDLLFRLRAPRPIAGCLSINPKRLRICAEVTDLYTELHQDESGVPAKVQAVLASGILKGLCNAGVIAVYHEDDRLRSVRKYYAEILTWSQDDIPAHVSRLRMERLE